MHQQLSVSPLQLLYNHDMITHDRTNFMLQQHQLQQPN